MAKIKKNSLGNENKLDYYAIVVLILEIMLVFFFVFNSLSSALTSLAIFFLFDLAYWFLKGDKNTTKIIILSSMSFIVLGTLGVYGILYYLKYTPNLNISPIGQVEDWIAYSGSVIGGSMTMFALIFSLHNEKEKLRKEKVLSLMPVIETEVIKQKNGIDPLFELYSRGIYGRFIIKNPSINHAINIKIDVSKYIVKDSTNIDHLLSVPSGNIIWPEIDLLPGKTQKEFKLEIVSERIEKLSDVFRSKEISEFEITLKIEISDILEIQRYTYETCIKGTFYLNDFDEQYFPIIDDEGNVESALYNKYEIDLVDPRTKLMQTPQR